MSKITLLLLFLCGSVCAQYEEGLNPNPIEDIIELGEVAEKAENNADVEDLGEPQQVIETAESTTVEPAEMSPEEEARLVRLDMLRQFNESRPVCVEKKYTINNSSWFFDYVLLSSEGRTGIKGGGALSILSSLQIVNVTNATELCKVQRDNLKDFIDVLYDPSLLQLSEFELFRHSVAMCVFKFIPGWNNSKFNIKDAEHPLQAKIAKEFMECIHPGRRQTLGKKACERLDS